MDSPFTHLVLPQRRLQPHIHQTVFANKQSAHLPVLVRIRRKVPRIDLVLADAQRINVLDLGDRLVLLLEGGRRRVHFGVRLLNVIDLVVPSLLVARDLAIRGVVDGRPDAGGGDQGGGVLGDDRLVGHRGVVRCAVVGGRRTARGGGRGRGGVAGIWVEEVEEKEMRLEKWKILQIRKTDKGYIQLLLVLEYFIFSEKKTNKEREH